MKEIDFQKQNYAKSLQKTSFLGRHFESQKYAWQGLFSIFKEEPNFRLELGIGIGAIVLGLVIGLTLIKMVIVLVVVALVLVAEIVNSIVERLCDIYTSEHDIGIKFIKDVAAGGVLLASIFAAIIGLIIFVPEILLLFA